MLQDFTAAEFLSLPKYYFENGLSVIKLNFSHLQESQIPFRLSIDQLVYVIYKLQSGHLFVNLNSILKHCFVADMIYGAPSRDLCGQ